MRGRASTLLIAAWIAACSKETRIPLPTGIFTGSLFIVVEEDENVSMFAASLTGETEDHLPPLQLAPDRQTLTVLSHAQTLEALGVEAGVVTLAEVGDPLPQPTTVHRAAFTAEGRFLGWDAQEALSARLLALRIAKPPTPCPGFERRDVEIPGANLVAGARLSSQALLVMSERCEFHQVDVRSGSVTFLGKDESCNESISWNTMYLAADGRIWLGATNGILAHTSPGPIDPVQVATSSSTILEIAGPTGDAPFELFLVHVSGRVSRFDGNSLQMLLDDGAPSLQRDMTWVGPGHALAVGANDCVRRFRDGAIVTEHCRDDTTDSLLVFETIAFTSSLGVIVAGAERGSETAPALLYSKDRVTGEWSELGRYGNGVDRIRIHAIAALHEGILFSGSHDLYGQYQPGAGICGVDTLPSERVHQWTQILALDEETFALLGPSFENPGYARLVVLEHRHD